MIRRPIHQSTRIVLGLLSVLTLLPCYTWLSYRQHQTNPNDTTIPTWSQLKDGVVQSIEPNHRSGERWLLVDAKATGYRLFLGLFYGITGSLIIGIFMGCFPKFEAFLYPLLSFFAKIPPTAAVAVFMVMAGLDTAMYVSMIAFGILPTMSIAIYLTIKSFPDELQFKAYTLGASHAEVIWVIIFKFVLPKLIETTRLMIGPAMVYLIAAEMVFGDVGFGYRIRLQSKRLNMSVVYPYLTLLAVFGYLMDFTLRRMERWLCPWHEQH
ncbi:MAG: putative aliphatic sulfonates transport permease protein SsuC [Verrucomicrobia subdivision 3 bacterium]|nr:putative aliphatic sulfonates transport permease protein SsuC [Limisphaerales bacterium]MCS1415643.1 putative aliphatic sulfonates transport permease protein SsuC [Limisphaerales bacterium]